MINCIPRYGIWRLNNKRQQLVTNVGQNLSLKTLFSSREMIVMPIDCVVILVSNKGNNFCYALVKNSFYFGYLKETTLINYI